MKKSLLFLLLVSGLSAAEISAPTGLVASRENQKSALNRFASGDATGGVASLRVAAPTAEAKVDADALLVERLIVISYTLSNQGKRPQARLAAKEALTASHSILAAGTTLSNRRVKDLQTNLSSLCESVLQDVDLAEKYATAAAASPLATANDAKRRTELNDKIKLRDSRGRR